MFLVLLVLLVLLFLFDYGSVCLFVCLFVCKHPIEKRYPDRPHEKRRGKKERKTLHVSEKEKESTHINLFNMNGAVTYGCWCRPGIGSIETTPTHKERLTHGTNGTD